jgi:hypothetical protein
MRGLGVVTQDPVPEPEHEPEDEVIPADVPGMRVPIPPKRARGRPRKYTEVPQPGTSDYADYLRLQRKAEINKASLARQKIKKEAESIATNPDAPLVAEPLKMKHPLTTLRDDGDDDAVLKTLKDATKQEERDERVRQQVALLHTPAPAPPPPRRGIRFLAPRPLRHTPLFPRHRIPPRHPPPVHIKEDPDEVTRQMLGLPPTPAPAPPAPYIKLENDVFYDDDIRPQKKKHTILTEDEPVVDSDSDVTLPVKPRPKVRSNARLAQAREAMRKTVEQRMEQQMKQIAERDYLLNEAERNLPLLPEQLPDPSPYELFPTDPDEDGNLLEDLVNYVTVPIEDLETHPLQQLALMNIIDTLSARYEMFAKLVSGMKRAYGGKLKYWFRPFLWLLFNGILRQIKRLDETPPERRNEAYWTIDQLCGMLLWGVR